MGMNDSISPLKNVQITNVCGETAPEEMQMVKSGVGGLHNSGAPRLFQVPTHQPTLMIKYPYPTLHELP